MNAPHTPPQVPAATTMHDLVEQLTAQYREAIAPVLEHHLMAMSTGPAKPYIELKDISEKLYLVKPIFIAPGESGLSDTYVIILTGLPVNSPNCYLLTYERKGVFDPAYTMPFLLRLFTNHPNRSILDQRRAQLLDVFEIEIQRQLKVLLGEKIRDESVSGLMYVSILSVDPNTIEQPNQDQVIEDAKENGHV
jgi:hypothetical protein